MAMTDSSSGNKLIAKNTIFLYLRKIVTLILAFYTSRLLLRNLGIEDFVLYGPVGSVVLMFI